VRNSLNQLSNSTANNQSSATGPGVTTTQGTVVYSTSTSVCPYTTVETVSGKAITVTSTSYSLIVTQVVQAETSQVTVAPPPTTVETYVLSTSTSYCPVTEIQTISGVAVTVISTETSLIQVQVPTTVVLYTTQANTVYETNQVYQTTTCIETYYTTVSAGETYTIATTLTNTIQATEHVTITKTLEAAPVTLETNVAITQVVTIPSEQTITKPGGTVLASNTVVVQSTVTGAPVVTTSPPAPAITSTAPVLTNVGASNNAPWAFAFAGAMAFLVLA
jgi:hypothetical protein